MRFLPIVVLYKRSEDHWHYWMRDVSSPGAKGNREKRLAGRRQPGKRAAAASIAGHRAVCAPCATQARPAAALA